MAQTRNSAGARPGPSTDLALPPPDIARWSARRKAAVVVVARTGVISREEACRRYRLSREELTAWEAARDAHGLAGLRMTRGPDRGRRGTGKLRSPADGG